MRPNELDQLPWDEIGMKVDQEYVRPLLDGLPVDQVISMLKRFGSWTAEISTSRGVPVALTPVVARFLAEQGDYDAKLLQLDRLVQKTRNGCFDATDELQRDLEFGRFLREYQRLPERDRQGRDPYTLFTELDELSLYKETQWTPSDQDLLEVKRAAYEAVGFLRFLQEFGSSTSRPTVVIGNDKGQLLGGGYGRFWVVEPMENRLSEDFQIRYDRVTSHGTMRLNVPSPFSKEFVQYLCSDMPHLVIVDGAGPSRRKDAVRFSRAPRGYANWFAVFNDLRLGDDPIDGFPNSILPENHLVELRKWHEYVVVKEQIERWVSPGRPYTSSLWAAEKTDSALLGEVSMEWKPPAFDDETPQIIFANPIIYRTNVDFPGRQMRPAGDGLPAFMASTMPYYLDSVDKRLRVMSFVEKEPVLTSWGEVNDNPEGPVGSLNPAHTISGFGPHGFERRVVGPTLQKAISVLQEHLAVEVTRLVGD